jgi:hypothetical protein
LTTHREFGFPKGKRKRDQSVKDDSEHPKKSARIRIVSNQEIATP